MKSHLLTLCLLAPLMTAGAARAEDSDRDGLSLSLGGAGVYRPEFKGSKDHEFKPLPFVGLRYGRGDYYVALDGGALRANVLPGDFLEIGPILSYERGRKDDIKNRAVRSLGEIDAAINAGVFVRKRWEVGGGDLTIGAQALTDTSKVHKGVLATIGLDYDRQLNDRWSVGLSLSTTWADRKYMQTYYASRGRGAWPAGFRPTPPTPGLRMSRSGPARVIASAIAGAPWLMQAMAVSLTARPTAP